MADAVNNFEAIDTGNYLLEHYPGNDILWITFDHAGLPEKIAVEERIGWAAPELIRYGWTVLAVKARKRDWFLKEDMARFFRSNQFRKIAEGKTRIILYGLSMGGFAALGYSTMIPGSTVFAISPQTTLHPKKVPWEKRFSYAMGENWDGPFADIATLDPAHGEAFVLYSPLNKFDGPHVDRIHDFQPLTLLGLRGNAHVPGGMLKESGVLKKIVQALADGTFSEDYFASLQDDLEASAAYHYYVGWESEDPEEREASLNKCLELAGDLRFDFYRQRVAGLRLRRAAEEKDSVAAIVAYHSLRLCNAWDASPKLKIMTARMLLRAGETAAAREVITEIQEKHIEGHPKLLQLIERCDEQEAEAKAEAASQADQQEAQNG